eukprot:13581386-Ditylum_brightwellii.AAC.1
MEADNTATKVVRLPAFGRTSKMFQMWWIRFKAYASMYDFMQSIGQEIDPDLPASKDDNAAEGDEGVRQTKAKKLNAVVIANLMMAFTSESLIAMIYASMSTKYPGGLAYKVVVALHEKYASKDL